MERLSIEEIIDHCNRKVKWWEKLIPRKQFENRDANASSDREYWEHRQVAEWLEQLKAYKDAEEKRLLLRLPCAVGDYAWDLISRHRFEVVSIELYLNGLVMFRCGNKGTKDYAAFSLEDIGDTWMLSEPKEMDYWHPAKANAEAALEKMKGE